MATEDLTGSGKFIDDLNAANPVGSSGGDSVNSMAVHQRGIKNVLKNTFPNVDAACTPTPAQVNLLTDQVGGFLLKGIIAAGGTVDAITVTFSPAITLTDGVIVIVRALGANTVDNPTFEPNGLGALTIVKGANSSLAANDISGVDFDMILKLSTSNANWTLLNPSSAATAQSTESVAGKAEIATQSEANALADDTKIITPKKLGGALGGLVSFITASGNFTAPAGASNVTVILGGGGGGGGGGAGSDDGAGGSGGEAGGFILFSQAVTGGSNYTVTIGAGGAGGAAGATSTDGSDGASGGDTTFDATTVSGGTGGVKGPTSNGGVSTPGEDLSPSGQGGAAGTSSSSPTAGSAGSGQGSGGGGGGGDNRVGPQGPGAAGGAGTGGFCLVLLS